MTQQHDPGAREEAERLRRRLYRPGATDQDRRRFAELEQAAEPMHPSGQVGPSAPPATEGPRATSRRRTVVLSVAAGLAAVALVTVVARPGTLFSAPAPAPSASASESVDTSEMVTADLVRLQPDSPTATTTASTVAGVPTRLQRFHGTGPAVVAVDVRDAQQVNGTLLVMLSPTSRAPLGWFATRAASGSSGAGFAQILAHGDPEVVDPDESPAYSMHVYDGAPPDRLAVEAPNAAAWTLTVAFLPRRSLPY